MSTVAESFKGLFSAALALVYPDACQFCDKARATAAEGFVCADCRAQVRFVEAPYCDRCGLPFEGALTTKFECSNCRETELAFSSARSAVVARDKPLEAIHRYKYQRALWFEPFLAELLISRAKPELAGQNWDAIIPIPLHATKQREREFNQAERLANHLSAATAIPLDTGSLRRVLPTRTQTLLSRPERVANVRKAFAMCPGKSLNGERIVLVDDVFTTGATTSACAEVLLAAGASEVCVWTLARGI